MHLEIQTSPSPENYVVHVTGEVDISNAQELRDAIDLALEQPTERVELDFSQVPYIDSTGIGVLVGAAHHAAERNRAFGVTAVPAPVLRVMKLLGVDEEIGIASA